MKVNCRMKIERRLLLDAVMNFFKYCGFAELSALLMRGRLLKGAAPGVALSVLMAFAFPAAAQTVSVSPTSLGLGVQPLGVTSSSKKITVSNTGGIPISISNIAISGDFSQTTTCGTSLAVSAQCTISIRFTPTAIGIRTGQVTITDNASGSPQVVSLKGTGTAVLLSVKKLTFPVTGVGSSSAPQTVMLTNVGSVSLSISKVVTGGLNSTDFIPSNGCGSSVAAGASCLISVTFNPTAAGTRKGSLNIYDNGGGSPQSVALSGSAVDTTKSLVSISVSPSNPSVALGKTQSFTATGNYSDNSTQDLTTTVTWSSSNTAVATISNSAGTQGQATSVATGSTTIMATSGSISGSTTLTVTPPVLTSVAVTPANPSIALGTNQPFTATGTLSDNTTEDLTTSVTWGSSNTAVATISNASGTQGQATSTGAGTTSITATSGSISGSTTLTVTVGGSGVTLSPASLNFGNQSVNSTSSISQAVTLTNGTGTALQIVSIIASGDFSQTNNCGGSLAAGNSCAMQVSFAPSAAGTRHGYVTVSDSDASMLQTATLSGTGIVAASTVTVSPRTAAVTLTQKQQFKAAINGSTTTNVNWFVDGSHGGNSTVGTISSDGLYTPPHTAGTHLVSATSKADPSQSASARVVVTHYAGTFTYHNDNARTGQNLNETVLTTGNVNQAQFGKLFSYPVDGQVYGQPLYVPSVNIGGQGTHNVVYVVTEHDSVYAFDANGATTKPLWHTSFINPGNGITTIPYTDISSFKNISPEFGITSTPVIDAAGGTLYVLARTKEVSGSVTSYVQRLHALDIRTGHERPGSPVVIQASVPGSGDGSVQGDVRFDSLLENQRTGLLLLNGVVYIAWGSTGDTTPFHGWVMGYDAGTLLKVAVFNTTPNGSEGGIWQGGGAPAADGAGNIFFMTGNGTLTGATGDTDFGQSFLKLATSGGDLTLTDFFMPFNASDLNNQDRDLGSSGPLLLPDQPAPPQHLIVGTGKVGSIYLLNRDNMGGFNSANDSQIIEETPPGTVGGAQTSTSHPGARCNPAYWQSQIYYAGFQDVLKAFRLLNGTIGVTPVSQSAASWVAGQPFNYPGAVPTVSANGLTNGIVWALQTDQFSNGGPSVLHAYDAANVSRELYNSSQAGSRDTAGAAIKFTVPTVADGEVFVPTANELDAYGLLP
jgi:uncharacterized protein YjdB